MRTNERSRNNFVISTAICLMMALNSTVAKSANEQGANKIADAVKAVNSEANKQYDNTDNAKAIRYSSKSFDADKATEVNNTLFCYPNSKINPTSCLNCEGDGKKCKVAPTYEVNGYNLPIYMSVDSNGFIKGLKDVIKPNEKLSANGNTLNLTKNRYYRYWDDSKGDYSSAYPVVCANGNSDVSDNIEQVKNQFCVGGKHKNCEKYKNEYNNDKEYVMRIGFKPKYNYDYNGASGIGYLKVPGDKWTETSSGAGGGNSFGDCLVPNVSASSNQYFNIKTGNFEKDSLSKSDYLPCGVQESFTGKGGYSSDKGVCGDEYIKRYEDSQGNDLMTTYTAWLINDKQGESFNSNYRTFDVPSRACYECKSTSIGNYCEEVIDELITYCKSNLDCIVYRAATGNVDNDRLRNPKIAENRLPAKLNCGGCLSKLETILKSKGFN